MLIVHINKTPIGSNYGLEVLHLVQNGHALADIINRQTLPILQQQRQRHLLEVRGAQDDKVAFRAFIVVLVHCRIVPDDSTTVRDIFSGLARNVSIRGAHERQT